jgi:acetyl-CoA carboxylase biotin carboxyl carrier protein
VDLTSDDVQDILHLLDGLPYGELHLETARFRLSLRRTGNGEWTQDMQVLAAPNVLPGEAGTAAPSPAAAGTAASAPGPPAPGLSAPAAPAAGGQPEEGLTEVRAPLLGTFYRAPRPGAPPFVDLGSIVEEDTVVGIIETMKLMNSVAAGVSGTVTEILLANAEFAEQGAVLMRIRENR